MINSIKRVFEAQALKSGAKFACVGYEEVESYFQETALDAECLVIMEPVESFSVSMGENGIPVFDVPVKIFFMDGFHADKDLDDIKDEKLGKLALFCGDYLKNIFESPANPFYSDWETNGTFIRSTSAHLFLGAAAELTVSTACNRLK